jgi:3-hydroxyisobutyrate dehydrogenase-like beta-hydroxyacid dehydrogenase
MMATGAVKSQTTPRVGFLGTGLMGSAMAHRLLDQRFGVIAWDRDSGSNLPSLRSRRASNGSEMWGPVRG